MLVLRCGLRARPGRAAAGQRRPSAAPRYTAEVSRTRPVAWGSWCCSAWQQPCNRPCSNFASRPSTTQTLPTPSDRLSGDPRPAPTSARVRAAQDQKNTRQEHEKTIFIGGLTRTNRATPLLPAAAAAATVHRNEKLCLIARWISGVFPRNTDACSVFTQLRYYCCRKKMPCCMGVYPC